MNPIPLLLALVLLSGCVSSNPCTMASMSASDLERQLVMGCGR